MTRSALPPAPTHAQLRAFHAVAVARSFTEAAQTLGVSQPAVSMHVRALEDAYGVELLTRGRPGVDTTELGRALLDTTRPPGARSPCGPRRGASSDSHPVVSDWPRTVPT
jgi:DNA-binding transcriptional ArsR family regulator